MNIQREQGKKFTIDSLEELLLDCFWFFFIHEAAHVIYYHMGDKQNVMKDIAPRLVNQVGDLYINNMSLGSLQHLNDDIPYFNSTGLSEDIRYSGIMRDDFKTITGLEQFIKAVIAEIQNCIKMPNATIEAQKIMAADYKIKGEYVGANIRFALDESILFKTKTPSIAVISFMNNIQKLFYQKAVLKKRPGSKNNPPPKPPPQTPEPEGPPDPMQVYAEIFSLMNIMDARVSGVLSDHLGSATSKGMATSIEKAAINRLADKMKVSVDIGADGGVTIIESKGFLMEMMIAGSTAVKPIIADCIMEASISIISGLPIDNELKRTIIAEIKRILTEKPDTQGQGGDDGEEGGTEGGTEGKKSRG